jgi:integrase
MVDVGAIMKILKPIWSTKSETASRVRGRVETIINWATSRGLREGENPARWKGHLEMLLPRLSKVRQVKHHAALPYEKIADFILSLRQQPGTSARALEFAILTGGRTSEVLHAKWTEIDLAGRIRTIPAVRMKGGREHRVPLSDEVVTILENIKKIQRGDYIFPSARKNHPLSNMAMWCCYGAWDIKDQSPCMDFARRFVIGSRSEPIFHLKLQKAH